MSQPLVMRVIALSLNAVKHAGSIIREVMKKGNLGIVNKVAHFHNAVKCNCRTMYY